jgi:hypothetical protein
MKLMRKFLLFSLIILSGCFHVFSQSDTSGFFKSPLKIPLFLAGNFGELRVGHFHAGIDLKTLGEIGQPVFAAGTGYISRIKIQSGGYGKSIYITHPNGYTSVYAHLDHYIPEIEKYVKESQYRNRNYTVDLYPAKKKFELSQGDLVAYSGNTGSSGGPHVHFEIRKTREETPQNVLLYHLPITDNLNPEFRNIYVYMLPGNQSVGNNGEIRQEYHAVKINDSSYEVKPVINCGTNFIGFAAEIYDYLNGSPNRCGIYKMEILIDNNPLFSFTIDNISFAQSKFINAHMDYELKLTENTGIHRLFKLPNDNLNIYNFSSKDGIFEIKDDSLHNVVILAEDAYRNKSVLKFSFRKSDIHVDIAKDRDSTMLLKYNEEYSFNYPHLSVNIPSGALFRDIFYDFSIKKKGLGSLSDTFYLHYSTEPLNSNITLKFDTDSLNPKYLDKLLFGRIDEKNELISEGGDLSNGYLTAFVDNFGKYIIAMDTVAPEIVPLTFIKNQKYTAGQQLAFNVKDNLSGIKTYNAYINDKWVLLEYDLKSDRMFYTIDKEKLISGNMYKLKLYIMDEKNNIAVYEGKFAY